MAPVAKVGGLGDVVTALARAVQEEGHLVEVVLPRCVCAGAGYCMLCVWRDGPCTVWAGRAAGAGASG